MKRDQKTKTQKTQTQETEETITGDIRHYDPDVHSAVHVTDTTILNTFLMKPGPDFNDICLGVIGWMQRLHKMKIIAIKVMSNHWHWILKPSDPKHLADFMRDVKRDLAKEIKKLRPEWEYSSVFDGSYHAIPISKEDRAQIKIFRYLMANGVKEHLVEKVLDWPGVKSEDHILHGERLKGIWYERNGMFWARVRGEDYKPEDFEHEEEVTLSRLPCWEQLTDEEYCRNVQGLVDQIEEKAAIEREREGIKVLGVREILRASPYQRSEGSKKKGSPPPRFHAATKTVMKMLIDGYREVLVAHRAASAILRAGGSDYQFPEGTFPPNLPFVPFERTRGQPA